MKDGGCGGRGWGGGGWGGCVGGWGVGGSMSFKWGEAHNSPQEMLFPTIILIGAVEAL